MDIYAEISSLLIEKCGLTKEIFDINCLKFPIQYEDYLVRETKTQRIYNQYFNSYKYREKDSERWESIALNINKFRINDIISIVNQWNHLKHEKVIDKLFFSETNQSIDNFQFHLSYDGVLIQLVIKNDPEESFIDIARKKRLSNGFTNTRNYCL